MLIPILVLVLSCRFWVAQCGMFLEEISLYSLQLLVSLSPLGMRMWITQCGKRTRSRQGTEDIQVISSTDDKLG